MVAFDTVFLLPAREGLHLRQSEMLRNFMWQERDNFAIRSYYLVFICKKILYETTGDRKICPQHGDALAMRIRPRPKS
jgi:hypothetical protein